MSRKYSNSPEVPTEVLVNRLKELSSAITTGRNVQEREFTMRIPAECDRDADLVLAEAAKRLKNLDIDGTYVKWSKEDCIKEIEELRAKLFSEEDRIAELERENAELSLLEKELLCEEHRFNDLSDQFAELAHRKDRYEAALIKLKNCDWVITPKDRMDAVREIARNALEGEII